MDSLKKLTGKLQEAFTEDVPLPVFGIDFQEPIWDEEFPGQRLDRLDKAFIEIAIEEGISPFFLSSAFLSKLEYVVKPKAIPLAVLKDGSNLHPIYAVHDIVKQPKRPSPNTGVYSEKWQGTWDSPPSDGRFINKTGLASHYGLSKTWIARLEAWMKDNSQTVFLRTNDYNPKGPPVRLYNRDVVESFIRIHIHKVNSKRKPKLPK